MMARLITNASLVNLQAFRLGGSSIDGFHTCAFISQMLPNSEYRSMRGNKSGNQQWTNQHNLLLACNVKKQSYKSVHKSTVVYAKKQDTEISSTQKISIKKRLHNKEESMYQLRDDAEKDHELSNIVKQKSPVKNKETFMKAIDLFLEKEGNRRRGAVDFVNGALKEMKDFDVHRDLTVYKKLLSVFKEGKFVAKTFWEVEMMYAPRQQNAAMLLLDYAERHGVMPDEELGRMIIAIFGRKSHVARKYYRSMYWLPKFANANPYALPYVTPGLISEVAMLVLRRMCVDTQTRFSEFEVFEEDHIDSTYIVSAQSPRQQELLANHSADVPLVVEGGFYTWGYGNSYLYFVLRSHVTDTFKHYQTYEPDEDDLDFNLTQMFAERRPPSALVIEPSEHELAEGTVVAMAMTGTSSKVSLMAWIKELELSNPRLGELPVYFHMRTPETGFEVGDGDKELTQEQIEALYGELAINSRAKRQLEQKRRDEEQQTISQHAS